MRFFGLEITRRKDAGPTPLRGSLWGHVREPFAGAWQQGMSLEPIGGLTSFSAVFACISRIASDIGKLEPRLLMVDGEINVPAPANSPHWRTLIKPNSYQNRIQFLIFWLTCKLLYGNAYAVKVRDDARGMVTGLYLLDPRRVTPMVTPQGDVYYSLGGDDLSRVPAGAVLPASEIIHDRGVTLWHPLIGVSPLYACALSATQGLRIQRNSSQFFENMSRPSGLLTAPGTIDDVTADRLKREWTQNYSAQNIGKLAVMGDGLKYEAMTIPAEAAQLIEQLDWTVVDVARAFGMPLYKIGAGPVPTAGNVEALETQYYTGCLQVLIESVELCLTQGLEVPTGYHVELNLDGLLRMDGATKLDMLSKAVGGAIMAPDEARQRLNMAPVPGGSSVYLQQQNYSLAALAKRDAQEDPFGTAKPPAPPPAPEPPTDEATDDQARGIAQAAVDRFASEVLPGLLKNLQPPAETFDEEAEAFTKALLAGFASAEVVSDGA